METIENNKLIAEFMNYAIIDSDGNHKDNDYKYHSDWNWLMPVVEKIESLSHRKGRRYYLFMEQSYVQIKVDRMNEEPFGKWGTSSNYDKIGAVYRAVVDFIKHYNQQNK